MEPRITTLDIRQFRAIRNLSIDRLGQVNLITGRNNTGKSSVLEAFRILASNASLEVISEILESREEWEEGLESMEGIFELEGPFPLSTLFHGFPQLSKELDPVVIASRGRDRAVKVSLTIDWFLEEEDSDGNTILIPHQSPLFGDVDAVPALSIEVDNQSRVVTFARLRRSLDRRIRRANVADEKRLPCLFVSPYGGERTASLGSLWDNVALSDYEEYVVDALRIIHPQISAVSMVGGEGIRRSRTAIVRAGDSTPRPVPLRSFGDGLNRLFGIVLSLVNAKGGLLLIDEFENGLHHTIQVDVWRTIFNLASRLDTQVVATSHSWDAVEAFQKASSEAPAEGVLIRLSRKDDDIIPTLFAEDELALITRDRIEVR